jgi:hypothetical protein
VTFVRANDAGKVGGVKLQPEITGPKPHLRVKLKSEIKIRLQPLVFCWMRNAHFNEAECCLTT